MADSLDAVELARLIKEMKDTRTPTFGRQTIVGVPIASHLKVIKERDEARKLAAYFYSALEEIENVTPGACPGPGVDEESCFGDTWNILDRVLGRKSDVGEI